MNYNDLSDLPELSDDQLIALVAYGKDRARYYRERAHAAIASVGGRFPKPGESAEDFEDRVPAYQRKLGANDLREALRENAKQEEKANTYDDFASIFGTTYREREARRAREEFARHEIKVSTVVHSPADAYAMLGFPLSDGDDAPSRSARYHASGYEYHAVTLDGEPIGFVRRKPKQSYWERSDIYSYPEGSEPRLGWNDGGYRDRFRKREAAAKALAEKQLAKVAASA